ncbi:hypothetical protein [Paenibacillus sinopodophylli]|uniref:hypothetical protein n=1 Tax=Paenibacillus sinopodophylli TaxID=1837342 RepID=UPI00110CB9D6|nr:hypothetical protein [Paenibacillus sinopodophylli]
MRKLLSLRHWQQTFVRIFQLLRSKNVSMLDKLIFTIPVFLYWVLPDVLPLPFLPVDDIAVTMVLAQWFARRMETKYNIK